VRLVTLIRRDVEVTYSSSHVTFTAIVNRRRKYKYTGYPLPIKAASLPSEMSNAESIALVGGSQFRAEIRYRDDGQGRPSCRMRGSYAANGNPETAFEVSDCAANATLPRVIR